MRCCTAIARVPLKWRVVCIVISSAHLSEEDLVFVDGEVDGEETRGEGGAEGVAVHEGDLGGHRLVLEEMFLGRDHVCQDLAVGLHDHRDRQLCQLTQSLQTSVGLQRTQWRLNHA